jgi:hypothetical protein
MTVRRTNQKLCDEYPVDFIDLSGAQSRNRTSDTRIFNGDGSSFLYNYSGLTCNILSVRQSVFLVTF